MRNLVFGVALVCLACRGTPTSPSGQPESFTWTVDGQSFTASSNGRGALRSGAVIDVTAADCSSGAILTIILPGTSTGTYNVTQGVSVSWTPDARTSSAANERWYSPDLTGGSSTGSGTLTVKSISGDWISGSFNVVAVPPLSNRDKTPKMIQGTFELSFKERTIC